MLRNLCRGTQFSCQRSRRTCEALKQPQRRVARAHKRYFGIVTLGREPLLLNAIMVREVVIRGFVQ